MGTAAKKKRPMRSRRSGVKKFELVKANLTACLLTKVNPPLVFIKVTILLKIQKFCFIKF